MRDARQQRLVGILSRHRLRLERQHSDVVVTPGRPAKLGQSEERVT